MSRINTARKSTNVTHESGSAATINATQQLRRSVLSCLLWEKEFYEDGQTIADRIIEYAGKVSVQEVADLSVEARTKFNLRHVPLLLCAARPNADAIYNTVNRADELAELLSIYWRNGRKPIPAQMKKGLARAFTKFNEYQLAKYNRDNTIKLRDVMFMVHPKPQDSEQEAVWKRLVDGSLKTPDTWETNLSAGEDKKETFERLIKEGKLGYLALLRNLRNMADAECNESLVREAILARKGAHRVFPFRYVAAARHAPRFEPELDIAMQDAVKELPMLKGTTVVLVDVSGSMGPGWGGDNGSDMCNIDRAAALGAIVNAESLRVFSFSQNVVEIPPRKGMSGVDAIKDSQPHVGTYLRGALEAINKEVKYDRIIVITDEQSHDGSCDPLQGAKGYMINIASNKNGVGYGRWVHIDGFSENVLRYIHELELQTTNIC